MWIFKFLKAAPFIFFYYPRMCYRQCRSSVGVIILVVLLLLKEDSLVYPIVRDHWFRNYCLISHQYGDKISLQNHVVCSVPWLLMRMFMGIWAVMASRLCCSALCSSRWCSSAGSAIFFSGGSPASSLSLSCSRAATWAAIAAWAAAACTAATECPAKAPTGKRETPTPGSGWLPSSSDQTL